MAALIPVWIDWIVKAFLDELHSAPVTLFLALIAILFAAIQFFDSLHVKSKMRNVIQKEDELVKKTETVTTNIENVSGRIDAVTKSIQAVDLSLSSRFIGTFPKHFDTINEIVSSADHFLLILTDWVSYGEYSTAQKYYKEYRKYLFDIRTKSTPSTVYILAYAQELLSASFDKEFPEKDFINELSKDRFKEYFHIYHPTRSVPKDYAEFKRAALEIEEEQRKELQNIGILVQEINQRSLMLFWLEDGEQAVFHFQTREEVQQNLSFRTRDIGLITSLYDLFEVNWKGPIPSLPHQR